MGIKQLLQTNPSWVEAASTTCSTDWSLTRYRRTLVGLKPRTASTSTSGTPGYRRTLVGLKHVLGRMFRRETLQVTDEP